MQKLSFDRHDSSLTKVCDLHVYRVPTELWRDNFNNVLNNVVTETISIGIIRVPVDMQLADIRDEIVQQLSGLTEDLVPRDYVFLRSVGRSLTTLRVKQEQQLKAKHFLPPVAFAPELYILEATPEIKEALAVTDTSSQSPPLSQRTTFSPGTYPSNYRNGYGAVNGKDHKQNDLHTGSPSTKDGYSRRQREEYVNSIRKIGDSHRESYTSENESDDERRRQLSYLDNRHTVNKLQGRSHNSPTRHKSPEDQSEDGDTQSDKIHENHQLQNHVDATRRTRQKQGKEREELLKRAKQIQLMTIKQRNEARDMWKKKYYAEKKKTTPLEDSSNKLQGELEALHARQLGLLEGVKDRNLKMKDISPSEKNNYIIQCARLQYEIEDLQRRVEHAKVKLTAEIKLRVQAQNEMKAVRSEAMQNRLSLRMMRAQPGSLGVLNTAR